MITITESASAKIKEMLAEEEGNPYLRIGVTYGGCSGLTYGMGFDTEKKDGDEVFEQNGITIVVDSNSKKYLAGTKIDYKENLMGGGFTIDNPNAIATCGCGTSFRTAEDAGKPEEC
ncbi:iron-sulfur cluster assembly accessory protein [Caldalkalibacillus thermarum TA2.A1]|uniref:Iron-sulfur cluster assembly accessory protein n=1 Tax=Caldalkalibacillus thermarum (strain TA2.A1) TaxID=986075 RepID=F5L9N8_CALTT|nr:iron-sulfur cluster insertion protein ErpA [Caldalkalibacillus thermarum]EGL81887.1 iron-sulfur cluster assembly accessory protein [Caldalkalibacillus thermarum TA2.A1]QZT32932.1 iron-sulfur cluster insertion protein ErpA [Caldalkalibacillus thermarum TA2.A1]